MIGYKLMNKKYKILVNEDRLETYLNDKDEYRRKYHRLNLVKLKIENLNERLRLFKNLEPNLIGGVDRDQIDDIHRQLAILYEEQEDIKNYLKEEQKYLDTEKMKIFNNKKLIATTDNTCFNSLFDVKFDEENT